MKNLITYVMSLCVLLSCELVVEVERPDFKPSIVVGSIINPSEKVSVQLSEDRYILDGDDYGSDFNQIEEATIRLYENDQLVGVLESVVVDVDEEYNTGSNYVVDFKPTKGQEYRLEVEKEGYTSVVATEQIPDDPATFSLSSFEVLDVDYGNIRVSINLDIEDSDGDDYYEFNLYHEYNREFFHWDEVNEEIVIDSVAKTLDKEYFYFEDEILFEDHLDGQLLIFDDALFQNSSYELSFNHEVWFYQDSESPDFDREHKLVFEVRKISEAYFNYYNSVYLQSWVEGDPFSEPVQVFSNIENGKGVFGSFISGTTVEVSLY